MLINLNWLREFIDIPVEPQEVAEKLTMAGLTVDAVEDQNNDTVFELDIGSNRGDCLSHLGVARELSAVFDVDLQTPAFRVKEDNRKAEDVFSVSISDPGLCSRYCGRYIEGVHVGPSPDWMVRKLESVGIRSINNVADVTNYILMGMGQPLHAFDADRLAGHAITVRRGKPEEMIETLDGKNRTLNSSILVIADSKRPVALAGIMGGMDTEISTSTVNVFLESACFSPMITRKASNTLNLSTEASFRFERGTDMDLASEACNLAIALIHELAGGRVYKGIIDVYPGKKEPPKIKLRRTRILQYLGMNIPKRDVIRVFERLEFKPVEAEKEGWWVQVPSHRYDITSEEDLMEEIARHYGYNRFPATLPAWVAQGSPLQWAGEERIVRETLSGLGYSEACTIPFENAKTQHDFAPDRNQVTIRNPLSEESPVLRTSMVPSMLRALQWNLHRGMKDIQLYELGKIYPKEGERQQLVLGATGELQHKTVHDKEHSLDFFAIKGDIETLLEAFNVGMGFSTTDLPSYYHPTRSIRVGEVAILGELHQDYTDLFKLNQKVYLAEIEIEKLYTEGRREIAVQAIPKYPSIRRDLCLILANGINYDAVVEVINKENIDELADIEPFDRLLTGPFPEDSYSLAIKLIYQAPDRTLTDSEVRDFDERIIERLKLELKATLRK